MFALCTAPPPLACCSTEWFDQTGVDRDQRPLLLLGVQGCTDDHLVSTPFLRLSLVLLAIGQHWRRSAALPAHSVHNQPCGDPLARSALATAVQQQLTPSCCSQLLQRVVPTYWVAVKGKDVRYKKLLTFDLGDMCAQQAEIGLELVAGVAEKCPPPVDALGE